MACRKVGSLTIRKSCRFKAPISVKSADDVLNAAMLLYDQNGARLFPTQYITLTFSNFGDVSDSNQCGRMMSAWLEKNSDGRKRFYCVECGSGVDEDEQVHQDYHVALRLNEQENHGSSGSVGNVHPTKKKAPLITDFFK
jgi:Ubiquitin-Binding Zinc Finger